MDGAPISHVQPWKRDSFGLLGFLFGTAECATHARPVSFPSLRLRGPERAVAKLGAKLPQTFAREAPGKVRARDLLVSLAGIHIKAIAPCGRQYEHLTARQQPDQCCRLWTPQQRRHPRTFCPPDYDQHHIRYPLEPSTGRPVYSRAGTIWRCVVRNMRSQKPAMSWPLRPHRDACGLLSSDLYGSDPQASAGDVYLLREAEDEQSDGRKSAV